MTQDQNALEMLLATFFEEAEDRGVELEALLLDLERDPDEIEIVHRIFRAVHSVKGAAGACELHQLARFVHAFESLLDPMRKGEFQLSKVVADTLFQASDTLHELVRAAKAKTEPECDVDAAVVRLQQTLREALGSRARESLIFSAGNVDNENSVILWDDEPTVEEEVPSPAVRSSWIAEARSVRPPARARPSLEAVRMISEAPASMRPRLAAVAANIAADPANALLARPDVVSVPAGTDPTPERADAAVQVADAQLDSWNNLSGELVNLAARLRHVADDPMGQLAVLRETLDDIHRGAFAIQERLSAIRPDGEISMIEGTTVRIGQEQYVIPSTNVIEYVEIAALSVRNLPTLGRVVLLRDRALPLHSLAAIMKRPQSGEAEERVAVIVRTVRGPIALLVDEVVDQRKVLLKRMEANLGKVPGFLGATPLGTGLALILAIHELFPSTVAQPLRAG